MDLTLSTILLEISQNSIQKGSTHRLCLYVCHKSDSQLTVHRSHLIGYHLVRRSLQGILASSTMVVGLNFSRNLDATLGSHSVTGGLEHGVELENVCSFYSLREKSLTCCIKYPTQLLNTSV